MTADHQGSRPPFRALTGVVVPVTDPSIYPTLPTEHLSTCFGCGSKNDSRLGIVPHYVDSKVVADLEFHPRFEGGPGLAHGGAIAAFFDDLLGFVALMHSKPAVTAKLEVNYRKPVRLGVTVTGEAWMAGEDGRKLFVEGAGYDQDGVLLVEASGLFLQVGIEHFTGALGGTDAPYPSSMFSSDEYYP